MRHLFYLHNLPLPDKVAAQKKKIKNKIPARLYIYFPYGEISNNNHQFVFIKVNTHSGKLQAVWYGMVQFSEPYRTEINFHSKSDSQIVTVCYTLCYAYFLSL